MNASAARYSHVVILGGGFAGTVAAIAISPHAERITWVERYSREPDIDWRGVPQGEHGHYLTQKGQLLLEKLIPGVLDELRARGAREIDWAKNASWTVHGGVTPIYDSGVRSLLFSRKLLDRVLFGRAAALGNLNLVTATVEELEFRDARVRSVRLSHGQTISNADLVIDARGRTARMRDPLEAVVGAIPERRIQNNITYHTISLDHRYDEQAKVQQYYRQPDLTNDGIGYLASPVEADRITFTVASYYGSRNARPFEVLRSHPLLQGRSLPNPRVFTNLNSVHTQYGRARTWVDNYLVVGDAVCRLNPVFAHGMTVALEMISALREELLNKNELSTHRLQRRFDRLVRVPWLFAQIDSIRTRQDPAPARIRPIRAVIRAMFFTTARDSEIHRTALRVVHRIDSPVAFFSPIFLGRVLAKLAFKGGSAPSRWRMGLAKLTAGVSRIL